jgi:hypothetical protein
MLLMNLKTYMGNDVKVTNSFSLYFVKYSPQRTIFQTQVVAVNYTYHEQLVCKMSWF